MAFIVIQIEEYRLSCTSEVNKSFT